MSPDGDARDETTHHPAPEVTEAPPRGVPRRGLTLLLGGLGVVLALAILFGIRSRNADETALAATTKAAAVPIVNVVHPTAGAPNQALVLPGSTEAFSDTAIYARINGYLKRWYFDIGAEVKQGALLAEVDAPEIDAQLRSARADLATADANLKLAAITAQRNEELLKTRSVSTQERDNATGAAAADAAIVQSRQATVAQLSQTQSYEKIYAPFDGVVTARNTDIGALIDAGSASASKELFHMAAIRTLRIYVAVPEAYSRLVTVGMAAGITLDEFPGRSFDGKVMRTANAIDPAARTLRVEVDVENPTGELLPGAYVFVHFSLPNPAKSVTVPVNALLFRKEGPQVGVVRGDKAELRPIKIGHDYGDRLEVLDGLAVTDSVILDPSDSLITGSSVRLAEQTP